MRVYRKYSIVIGQTKILPVIAEKKQMAVINNMIALAKNLKQLTVSENNDSCVPMQIEDAVEMDMKPPAQCALITSSENLLSLNLETTIPDSKSVLEGTINLLTYAKLDKVVYANSLAYAAMTAAMPITGSIEEWFASILDSSKLMAISDVDNPEFTYANYMNGGIDEKVLRKRDRLSLLSQRT